MLVLEIFSELQFWIAKDKFISLASPVVFYLLKAGEQYWSRGALAKIMTYSENIVVSEVTVFEHRFRVPAAKITVKKIPQKPPGTKKAV